MRDVVGKEYVGDVVLLDVFLQIAFEVTAVYDMDLFERGEEVTCQCIAETVFEDEESTSVVCGGLYPDDFVVTAAKYAIAA